MMTQHEPLDENTQKACAVGAEALWSAEGRDWGTAKREDVLPILTGMLEEIVETVYRSEYHAGKGTRGEEESLTWRFNDVKNTCIEQGTALRTAGVPVEALPEIIPAVVAQAEEVYREHHGEIKVGSTALHESRYGDIFLQVTGDSRHYGAEAKHNRDKIEQREMWEEQVFDTVFKNIEHGEKLKEQYGEVVKDVVIQGIESLLYSFDQQEKNRKGDQKERWVADTFRTSVQVQNNLLSCLIDHLALQYGDDKDREMTNIKNKAAYLHDPIFKSLKEIALAEWLNLSPRSFEPEIRLPNSEKRWEYIYKSEIEKRSALLPPQSSQGFFLA